MPPLSPFPPDFAGNPWSYGFALFGSILIASLSLAQLLAYALERRRLHAINTILNNPLDPAPHQPWNSALTVHRSMLAGLLLALFLPTSTDAVVLLTWGEVGAPAMKVIFLVNYLANGMASVPFIVSMLLWCWASQTIPQKLAEKVPLPPLSWRMLRDKMKIAVVVFVIAVGVTIGKAGVA